MVLVNLPNIPPINFVSAYRPPYDTPALFTIDFESLYAYNSAIFIAGDLNAKHRSWNCTRTCTYGKQLLSFAKKTNARIIAPDTPTHFHYSGSTIIDIALARNMPYDASAYALTDLSSDHLPVKFLIDTGTPPEIPKKFIPNWKNLKDHLGRQPASPPPPAVQMTLTRKLKDLLRKS
ncbi:hypothetical protein AVEN_70007-1 [Araneus ventricosus]|uniref:Endonuclease/exonuclease/phosphatase domain-containing protein n=1 Tax=Araneus ventricosus TaxID=182803 RepID=A0A4Y2TM51_ARAVE|nr:hypothetical protein AVEN_251684-1 [Araneus ventricosus]GBO01354.1 hypothetical protein AVEN_144728-1 [Araneus ventricosus]GBO01397.1 hypothetical protein AVEN_66020-1 [Araneus ventricosus]GBO01408.1 hypothetical protein AVEN_70007-1 [Araneus ventricosus]